MPMQVLDRISAVLAEKGRAVYSVKPDATVYESLEIISEKNIGCLLIMEDQKLLGIFSERDYARKVALRGRTGRDTHVSEVMSQPPLVISPDGSVEDAMRIVTDARENHVAVVDARGAVLGVVSIGDLVKWIITSHEKTIKHLESYITGQHDSAHVRR